jgi:aryl-alcohol dehydrogenase-like predicted oxidoreductase
VEALQRRAHEVLDAAYESGVRYFDAARSYGRAEDFLAAWLDARGLAPGAVFVASKWGYTYTAGWQVDADPPEVKDLSAAAFRRQLRETRARLGDHLCLYQIHSATLESGVLEDAEVRSGLAELRGQGVAVGLTVTGTGQGETIDRGLAVGGFDAVQATWNLLERGAGPALERAHDAGLRVVVKEAVANGRLTARGDQPRLVEAAARLGAPPDALAIAAALARPWSDVVLSGAASVQQLRDNLQAPRLEWTPELEATFADAASAPEEYWERRSSLQWT